LWPDKEGDGGTGNMTPGKIKCKEDEGWRLEKVYRQLYFTKGINPSLKAGAKF